MSNPTETLANIDRFLQLSDSVATAGQPTPVQFSAIKNSGYKVIVNLALSASPNAIPNEREIVEALGMQYIHIPVSWEYPRLEDFDRFLDTITVNIDKKIFVHCAANKRVSAFMYLYRRICDRAHEENAQKDLYRIWVSNKTWQQFIEQVLINYQYD